MVLGGRRAASVSMTDILFHALLFALGLYVVGYFTRTYHVFEGFGRSGSKIKKDERMQQTKTKIREQRNKRLNPNQLSTASN